MPAVATTTRLQALDRRYLGILGEGGARKHNVLRALASSEEVFKRSMARLRAAGLVTMKHCRGGVMYDLARKRRGH